uniref:Putative secreted protein n=1 Tax=Anopheles darlingi TaxID=43151 RepID=A0A2M4D3W2_ANODA
MWNRLSYCLWHCLLLLRPLRACFAPLRVFSWSRKTSTLRVRSVFARSRRGKSTSNITGYTARWSACSIGWMI